MCRTRGGHSQRGSPHGGCCGTGAALAPSPSGVACGAGTSCCVAPCLPPLDYRPPSLLPLNCLPGLSTGSTPQALPTVLTLSSCGSQATDTASGFLGGGAAGGGAWGLPTSAQAEREAAGQRGKYLYSGWAAVGGDYKTVAAAFGVGRMRLERDWQFGPFANPLFVKILAKFLAPVVCLRFAIRGRGLLTQNKVHFYSVSPTFSAKGAEGRFSALDKLFFRSCELHGLHVVLTSRQPTPHT